MKPSPFVFAFVTLASLVTGCMPSGVYSTARTLAPGEVQHAPLVEVPVATYERPNLADARYSDRIDTKVGGLQPGYAVRGGVADDVEIGAHLFTTAAEINAKVRLADGKDVALAVAPRVTGALSPLGGSGTSLLHARIPVLLTWEPASSVSFTPRAGLGFAQGWVEELGFLSGSRTSVSLPFLEGGLGFLVQATARFGLSFDAYALRSLGDAGGREMRGGGAGLAFVIGPPATRRPRGVR